MAITTFSAFRGLFLGMAFALFAPVALAALPGKWHSVTVVDAVMAPDFRLNVTPNPNDGRFRLHVQGTFTDTVELVIINAEGKKVYTRKINEPGEFLFNLTPLRQGIYFAQLREANKVVSLPILYAFRETEPTLPVSEEPMRP